MSSKGFASSGILLFIDILLTSVGGWFFWIMISKFALVSEIGQAATIFGLVILIGSISQLGFEYPLLKNTYRQKSETVSTIIVLELIIIIVLLPLALYSTGNFFNGTLEKFNWITIALLFVLPVGILSRFALLGLTEVRKVFIIDSAGIVIRFVAGYFLLITGFGTAGILLAFLMNYALVMVVTLFITSKKFRFNLGSIQFVKKIISDGLINFPSKLGRVLIISLSVVCLAFAGVPESEVGVFYIAVTLTIIIGGGLATSLAFMVIPSSTISKNDLSDDSWRIGLSLSAPIITALVVGPERILSLIGPEYVEGELVMLILAIGIFPLSIVMNSISKFNNKNLPRKILVIGLAQLGTFLIASWILIPLYESLGASIAILIGLCAGAIPSMMWSNRMLTKYVIISGIAILIGWLSGNFVEILLKLDSSIAIIASASLALILVILMKNISTHELVDLVKSLKKRN